MNQIMKSIGLSSLMVSLLLHSGCKPAGENSALPPPTTQPAGDEAAATDASATDMDRMKVALAKLSPEDAASAEQQHFCPVSGEMLGTMGVPIKVDVNGTDVWICCDSCREDLLADPDKYLAKLKPE